MPRAPYSYREDPAVPAFADDRPVAIFDGMCVFCSRGARLLMRIDRNRKFRFMAAQSPPGEALFRHYGLVGDDYETMILLEGGRLWQKSDASIRILRGLGLPWSILSVFGWLPRALRDRAYDTLARNRYRWFGRRETCFVPARSDADRFVG
ncbi:MAG: DCC1-like thiol-disulfide oxidoreductase family protein [Pseudomonadota bacterium]|nr:DCC1-like thiol-disulfide oxidoreductase family protein [Pseudomonadota bacterium]